MCEYCEGYKKVVEEWERPHGYIDYIEAVKDCSLYQDEDPEGNGYTVVFGDGTVYEFLLPGVVDRLSFKYCPMCGRDLATNGKPGKPSFAGETVYYISDHEDLENDCFYSDLEVAKEAAVYSSEYNDMTQYVHELVIERKFRTEPVTTYKVVESC